MKENEVAQALSQGLHQLGNETRGQRIDNHEGRMEIDALQTQVQKLEPKEGRERSRRKTQRLRDTVDEAAFQALMESIPASTHKKRVGSKNARLRTVYTLLYYTGVRVNELRRVTLSDLMPVVEDNELPTVLDKQKDTTIRQVSSQGSEAAKRLQAEIDLVFKERKLQHLGESPYKPGTLIPRKAWIGLANTAMRKAKSGKEDGSNHKSHPFRAGFVSRALERVSVQHAAQLIGHESITSTMAYNRHTSNKDKKMKILDQMFDSQP